MCFGELCEFNVKKRTFQPKSGKRIDDDNLNIAKENVCMYNKYNKHVFSDTIISLFYFA